MDVLMILQMFAALAFIIVLANIILKKLSTMQQSQAKAIKIIERAPVSKTSALCIVDIASTYYLMSVSDTGNEIIRELTEEEKVDIDRKMTQKQEALKESLDFSRYSNWTKKKANKLKDKYQETFGSD